MSLFDLPNTMLNPALWDANNQLRPEVKTYLLDLLQQIYPMTKVSRVVMIGSNVGYQYGPESDIDVNVMARKGETFEAWHPIFKAFNNRPNYFPNTKNPINFFFQEYVDGPTDWGNSLGAYDLIENAWKKNPISFKEIGDPEKKYEREIAFGHMMFDMIQSTVNSAVEAYDRGDRRQALDTLKTVQYYIKQLDEYRKTAYQYKIGTPALQEANIIFKLIEHSNLNSVFERLLEKTELGHNSLTPKM